MLKALGCAAVLLMAAATCTPRAVAGAPAPLWGMVPPGANALLVGNVDALFQSPVGVREAWRKTYADAYAAEPLLLPSDAMRFVLAADMDLAHLQPQWQAAVLEVSQPRTVAAIATRTGGVVDQIDGQPAVHTPHNAYVVPLQPRTYGVYAPANRQAVARWLQNRNSARPGAISAYLGQMAEQVASGQAQFGLAIDLRDVLSVHTLRGELALSAVLADAKLNVDQVAQTVAGLQGITLLVRAENDLQGELDVDFQQDVGFLGNAAGPFVLEQLRRLGAALDEVEQWKATTRGNRIVLSGPLTATSLRKTLSLFSLTHSPTVHADPAPAVGKTTSDANKSEFSSFLSQRYFQTIASYVNELQRSLTTASPYQVTLWLDNYAERIENLPWAGVDPELQQYGRFVSTQLRTLLAGLNETAQQTMQQQARITPQQRMTYGMLPTARTVNYGGYQMRQYVPFAFNQVDPVAARQQQLQLQQQTNVVAIQQTQEVMSQIARRTAEVRAEMTERYELPF